MNAGLGVRLMVALPGCPGFPSDQEHNTSMSGTSRIITAVGLAVLCALSSACTGSPKSREATYLHRGEDLLEKKDYSRALLELRNASAVMPRDAEPYYQMGIVYVAMGDIANGVAFLQKATELNPQHGQAQLKLAELMTGSRNKETLQQAASQIEAALGASPDDADAVDALALAEWKLGKTDESVGRLEDTLKKFPSRLQTSVELARLKLSQKDLGGAEEALQSAVANAPQSAAAELALGQFYMIANQPSKAEAELRKVVQLDAKNGPGLQGLATILAAGNRLDEAEKTYRLLASLPNPEYKPLHALFLYKLGRRDEAVAEFEKLAKAEPDDRAARSRLLSAYLATGRNKSAEDLLAVALRKNPKDVDALFESASVCVRSGRIVEAEKDITEVLRLKPDFAEGHLVMAAIYKARNQKLNQRKELSEALRIKPALFAARAQLARSFILANEAKSAVDLLDNTPSDQKGTVAAVVERNWALLAAGQNSELRAILDQTLRVGRVPELVLQDAFLRFLQGDHAGALVSCEEAIKDNPEDMRAVRLLADTYVAMKQPAKAEDKLKAISAAHPQSAPLANLMGQWYLEVKKLPAARQAFDASIAADPNYEPPALALARLDYQEKLPSAARRRLLALVATDPANVSALLMLGDLGGETGDQEEAVRRYRAVLKVDSSNISALNNLAYILAGTDPDTALTYAQQVAQLAPHDPAVEDTIARVYYRKAIYGEAVSLLENAVATESTPRRQFHLAMSYLKSGKRELGQKALQLALAQDPKLSLTEKDW
jgi:tetratricopeptide (TPR) repeat protein